MCVHSPKQQPVRGALQLSACTHCVVENLGDLNANIFNDKMRFSLSALSLCNTLQHITHTFDGLTRYTRRAHHIGNQRDEVVADEMRLVRCV